MKSLDGQKSNNDDKKESAEGKATGAAPAPVVEEKIDFSNVVIEPMFEDPKNRTFDVKLVKINVR